MRVVTVVLVLMLGALARAEDDGDALDARPLGEAIPERMEALQQEWGEEVGTKDPVDEPPDEPPDEVKEMVPAPDAPDEEPLPVVREPDPTPPAKAAGSERSSGAPRGARETAADDKAPPPSNKPTVRAPTTPED